MISRLNLRHRSRYRGLSAQKFGRSGLFLILGLALTMTRVACAGSAGVAGPQGPAGAAGAAGQAGADGPAGEGGETGTAGAQGPAGAAGQIGPTGPEGAQGVPAQSGQSIASVVWIGDPGFRERGDSRNKNFLPNATEVSVGGRIRFVNAGGHQLAVYKVPPGTTRQDVINDPNAFVDTSINSPFNDSDIGDPNNRIALGPSRRTVDLSVVDRDNLLGMDITITEPGLYLAICAIRSHFLDDDPAANGGMFGFIDVVEELPGQGDASLTDTVGYAADVTVGFGDPRFRERGDRRNNNFLPNAVEVDAGDNIRFLNRGGHQLAVYKVAPDTTRQDVINDPNAFVDTSINSPFSDNDIDDSNNRIALGAGRRTVDLSVVNRDDALSTVLTLNEPGRYLVICAIRTHFLDPDPGANGGMFGFVTVR